jgi:hypothetical protein
VDLPELAPSEQALLHRFRADESPSDAVVRRVEAGLAARLDAGDDPVALAPDHPFIGPFSHVGKAAVIAFALAAAVLLVLGGSARLVHAVRSGSTAEQASDVRTPVQPSGRAQETAPAPAPSTAPVVIPEPPTATDPPAPSIELAAVPGALDAPRRDASRPAPKSAPSVEAATAPADAAAEIALLHAAKREPDAKRRLAKVDEYASKFPQGALRQEVAVLEIESLCQLGRNERAAEKSAAFLRQHPDSAYAAIARRGCSPQDGKR